MNYYSYSKIGSYKNCPLKYDLSYIKKIRLPQPFTYDVAKGLVFHKYSELFQGNRRATLEVAFEEASKEMPGISELPQDDKQKIIDACYRFDWLYDNFIQPKKKFVKKEYKISDAWDSLDPIDPGTLEDEIVQRFQKRVFTGYVDLFVDDPDQPIILDYKTPQTVNLSLYKGQLLTYAYFIHRKFKYPLEKIKLFVYFPFARDVETEEQRLKEIKFSKKKVLEEVSDSLRVIDEIENNRRDEAQLGFLCKYCSYAGTEHCQLSVIAGAKPPSTEK